MDELVFYRNQQSEEERLRHELLRNQEEKEKYFGLIKKLEKSLEIQLERENELKRRLKESDKEVELKVKQRIVDTIVSLQQSQQDEIRELGNKVEALVSETSQQRENTTTPQVDSGLIDQLQRENSELSRQLSEMSKEIEGLATQLELSATSLTETQRAGQGLQETNERLRLEVLNKNNEVLKARNEMGQQRSLVDELRQRIDQLSNNRQSNGVQVKELQSLYETDTQRLIEEVQRLKEELSSRTQTTEAQRTSERVAVAELELLVKDLQSELMSLGFKNEDLTLSLQRAEAELETERSSRREQERRQGQMTRESQELSGLRERYKSLKREHETLTKQNYRISDDTLQFNSELKKYRDQISGLMMQIDELTNEKIFTKAKMDRLEKKIFDLLETSDLHRKQEFEQERIKNEILSEVTRAQVPEPQAGQELQRDRADRLVPGSQPEGRPRDVRPLLGRPSLS